MSDSDLEKRGEIPLHDSHAIGLQLDTGRIGLYKIGVEGWMVGIRLNLDMRHYRAEGETSNFMKLNYLELTIPGSKGNYIGRIEGWDYYKSLGYFDYYKPNQCQLLPGHIGFTTFAWLDEFEEADPYYYFGWGLRTDHLSPYGYQRWNTVAYMGVNYPIEEYVRPSWVEIPPENELLDMVKPGAPDGQWSVKAAIGQFTVDPGVAQDSHIVIRVKEGRKRYCTGVLDFVSTNAPVVGEDDEDWSGAFWGSYIKPGEITFLSGGAKGYTLRVVGSFYTGDNPPAGYPAKTWCIMTDSSQISPSQAGAHAGDEYILTSPFDKDAFKLVEFKKYYEPGTYPSLVHNYTFTPIL